MVYTAHHIIYVLSPQIGFQNKGPKLNLNPHNLLNKFDFLFLQDNDSIHYIFVYNTAIHETCYRLAISSDYFQNQFLACSSHFMKHATFFLLFFTYFSKGVLYFLNTHDSEIHTRFFPSHNLRQV